MMATIAEILGEQMNDNEYIDFVFDGNHMQINQAVAQHAINEPFV